jgi:catalase
MNTLGLGTMAKEHADAAPVPARRPTLSPASIVLRLALIGVVLVAVATTFAYLGGWLSPHALTPARFTDGFEQAGGAQAGFRRNHAKGLGVTGFFESNGNGVRLSKAAVFRAGRVPVIGRFSFGGGQPYAADKPGTVRGLGIEFSPPGGEVWRSSMVNLPVFPFRTPEAFYENMFASKPDPDTGKPDPAKVKAFLERHPDTERVLGILKSHPISSGFENSAFFGLNAFRFTNAAGATVAVRWQLAPEQPFESAAQAPPTHDPKYLFEGLIAKIHRQPLHWRLLLVVAQPGDPTGDATQPWPETREQVDAGTLTLDRVYSDENSPATDITFDPLVLPDGIAPSDDPLLSARSAVYSQSYTRRAGETKQTPAITPADVRKGE